MKKGMTIAEVLVALAVFSIMFVSSLSIYVAIQKQAYKQKEFLRFESICLDIDKIYDAFGRDNWVRNYFDSEELTYYYNDLFIKTNDTNSKYKLTISYIDNEMIINVYNSLEDRIVIDSLNYGASKYDQK